MKRKVIVLLIILILLSVGLSGCEDEDRGGLHGIDSDFIGTWTTGAGSFTMGDSIRFNQDYTCDFFWSHSSTILLNGTWDRTFITGLGYSIVITMGTQEFTYKYDFFDSYKTLRLQLEGSTGYVYYGKQ